LHFPLVDATQWQETPDSLWKLMADALIQATQELPPPPENNVIPFSEDERAFRLLQGHLQWICQKLNHQVMFILDDFDHVLKKGPLAMLEQLNVLRSEGNRGYLSYLVMTKRLPHILGQGHPLENQSKFYDLFRHNIYALELYDRDDAIRMLQHLNQVADNRLTPPHLEQIYSMAGGHARLLKLVFNVWVEDGAAGIKTTYFAEKPDIKQECQRILEHLHEHEQEVALRAARGTQTAEDKPVLDHLQRRGLVVELDPVVWFSPLMKHFLTNYAGKE
jgi:hypothetical protein